MMYLHWRDQGAMPARFWNQVDRSGECWVWKGAKNSGGYGHVSVGGKMVAAHRFAWEQRYGKLRKRQMVLHRCDNRTCVRLEHLFKGTHKLNMKDCWEKGRKACGERNGQARFTEEIIKDIRALHANGRSANSLRKDYRCALATMLGIVNKQTWRHVQVTGESPR